MSGEEVNESSGLSPPRRDSNLVFHTPAVDFIENRSHEYHRAFDSTVCRCSPTQNKFVPLSGASTIVPRLDLSSMTVMPPGPILPQPRPNPSPIGDMSFWAEVFPEAMKRLNDEPQPYHGRYRLQWSIRDFIEWQQVQEKLDMARREYDHFNGHQQIGKFRRKLRGAMDKSVQPLKQAMKLVPDIEIASPVVGAIELLVDAYRQAATVRETVNSGFDDLPETFARMEFYLKSYPKDENIFGALIDLVFAIFKAIEEAIRFYTSAQGSLAAKHAGLAILTGEEYQQKLQHSLKEITVYSEKLEARASLSFTHRMISDGDASWQSHAAIMEDNWATHQVLGVIMHGQLDGNAQTAWIAKLLTRILGVLGDRENNWPPFTSNLLAPNIVTGEAYLPGPTPTPTPGPRIWTKMELLSHLVTPPLDEVDLQDVLCNAGEAILEHRERAEQLMATQELRDWMTCPETSDAFVGAMRDLGPDLEGHSRVVRRDKNQPRVHLRAAPPKRRLQRRRSDDCITCAAAVRVLPGTDHRARPLDRFTEIGAWGLERAVRTLYVLDVPAATQADGVLHHRRHPGVREPGAPTWHDGSCHDTDQTSQRVLQTDGSRHTKAAARESL
ncbi:hypothetical protein PG996_014031 [Apiospora saccharicola]|uniref:Uncharacterized protein n=1 Tax=Apiospora saccharicola TaxID=335842 RepID=A0ABR1THT7_9PEZI